MIFQNDIVLVPFPFADQSHKKVRPAAIVSNNKYNKSNDVIVCAITSNIVKRKHSILLTELPIPSRIRVDNILKIDKHLIHKKIGTLKKKTSEQIKKELNIIFS